ncbi:MAG: DNA polymerase III subunit beta [Syntrophales bacterium]
MEFRIKRDVLLEGVQRTLGIVEKRTTMPILNNILIRAGADKIRIIATNREIGLIADYEAGVKAPGEITLSARKLYEMIREVPGEDIHFEMNDANWITLTSGKMRYRIPGVSADDFPKVDDDDNVIYFKVNGGIIRDMINKTFFAMSTEEMRVNLNGALFETEQEGDQYRIKMVATDGYRLSLASADIGISEFLHLEKGIILPRKGISEIRKIIEADDHDVEIGAKKGQCLIKKENVLLKVNLIDSEYPDYRKVISMDREISVELDRELFLQSLRRMGVISSEKYSGVVIKLSNNKMLLNSTNPDIGEASDEMDISYSDKEIEVAYNVKYLLDAIEAIDDKKIIFEIREGLRPGTIRPAGSDGYQCVIVALKV